MRIETKSQSLTESPALQVTDSLLSLPNMPRKRPRRYIMRNPEVADDTSDSDDVQHIETSLSEGSEYSIEHEDDESESDDLISEIFENYSPPTITYTKTKKK